MNRWGVNWSVWWYGRWVGCDEKKDARVFNLIYFLNLWGWGIGKMYGRSELGGLVFWFVDEDLVAFSVVFVPGHFWTVVLAASFLHAYELFLQVITSLPVSPLLCPLLLLNINLKTLQLNRLLLILFTMYWVYLILNLILRLLFLIERKGVRIKGRGIIGKLLAKCEHIVEGQCIKEGCLVVMMEVHELEL